MCEALRRQAGRDLAIIILVVALTLGAVTAHSGKQTVRAQDAATPVAVIPAETPVAPVESTSPAAPEPSPTVEMTTATPEPSPTVSPHLLRRTLSCRSKLKHRTSPLTGFRPAEIATRPFPMSPANRTITVPIMSTRAPSASR